MNFISSVYFKQLNIRSETSVQHSFFTYFTWNSPNNSMSSDTIKPCVFHLASATEWKWKIAKTFHKPYRMVCIRYQYKRLHNYIDIHTVTHIHEGKKKCWWIHLHSRGIHNKKRNSLRNRDSGFFMHRYSHFGLNNAWFLIRFVRENGRKKPRNWE